MFDSPAIATAPGEARSNNQLFGELLTRLGSRARRSHHRRRLVAATLAASEHRDELADAVRARGVASPPSGPGGGERPIPFVDAFPGTPDRKIHLVPASLEREAGGLYTVIPDPGTAAFPLALISPALATQISSTFGQLREAPGAIEISTADAAHRGIRSGDQVRVWNTHGEVHCLANVSSDVREGVCVLAKGLWRKHTTNGMTANALIPATLADLGGQAAYNDARVEISRLG